MVGEELVKQLGDIPTSFVVGNCPNLSTWAVDLHGPASDNNYGTSYKSQSRAVTLTSH